LETRIVPERIEQWIDPSADDGEQPCHDTLPWLISVSLEIMNPLTIAATSR